MTPISFSVEGWGGLTITCWLQPLLSKCGLRTPDKPLADVAEGLGTAV
jgi:hypothetical protein